MRKKLFTLFKLYQNINKSGEKGKKVKKKLKKVEFFYALNLCQKIEVENHWLTKSSVWVDGWVDVKALTSLKKPTDQFV